MFPILKRLINARYSLPSWLWVFVSAFVGAAVSAYALLDPDGEAKPFLDALPFYGKLWGPLLVLFALCSVIGMAKNSRRFVQVGSMGSFCLWIFGSIAFYITGGIVNTVLLAVPLLVFWAYKYLATYVREYTRL